MRGPIRATLAAVAASSLLLAGAANAAEPAEGWVANPGTTVTDDGTVVLDASAAPTSYENQDLQVAVKNGDMITFEYEGTCSAGAPRVFIQGGAYNTWDADPMGASCGTDTDGDGWPNVTGTVAGITDGMAGYTGIVNDVSANGVIKVRDLKIAGTAIELVEKAEETKPKKANHGQCVKAAAKGGEERSKVAKSDCGKDHQKAKKALKAQKAKKAARSSR